MSEQIEALIAAEHWKAARRAIRRRLRKEPNSHWLITRLSLTYYEERDYETAWTYSQQALGLAPRCPLVLWDYAGTLDMLGRTAEAIAVYRRLVRRDLGSLAYGKCGEGLARARGLLADCLYRLALCYRELGRFKRSAKFFEQHLAQRGPGCRSIYPLAQVRKKYKELRSRQHEHAR
ncbi:MAG: tetratricopeptide repeat protein [Thermoguttaceae bacterium]|jgi:tetratricopeptide (TPR) repeat protein